MDNDALLYIGAGYGAIAYAYNKFDCAAKAGPWVAFVSCVVGCCSFVLGIWLGFKGSVLFLGWTL